ncbi:N-6 DNA methylase [Streptomyces sp. NPDC102441]|uniref:N-6 DNA methylase n=1 Tax=Streptomyces sp. NPDC102441 TaxID=3366176 RepID=UPI00382D55AF
MNSDAKDTRSSERTRPKDPTWLPSARARRAFLPDPQDQAQRLISSVTALWPSGSSLEVPLGTTATLALLPLADPASPELAHDVAALEPSDLMVVLRHTWAHLWLSQPYLVERAQLLWRWLADPPPQTAEAVTELTHHLFRGGILEFGTDPGRYLSTDLLGRLMQQLNSRGEKSRRGAFHTPDVVTDHMVEYLAGDLEPGTVIGEPAAGSGAIWRAQARLLHVTSRDPAVYRWIAAEVDPLAAAVLGANSLLFRLGPDVLIACADALAGDSGLAQAQRERDSAMARRDAVRNTPPD